MTFHEEFINTVLDEMRNFLLKNYLSLTNAPPSLATEVRIIAHQLKSTTQPTQIRSYLTNYISMTSSFWRIIAPYTAYNKLLTQLENVLKKPQFSAQSIKIAHLNSIHEHYLSKQKELIEPLQTEIQALRSNCQTLESTVISLREENRRLTLENEFFMRELLSIQSRVTQVAIIAAEFHPPEKKDPPKAIPKNPFGHLFENEGPSIF